MEIIEEYRDLTVMEWNVKETLNEKLSHLLEQQRVYWKQRGKVLEESRAYWALAH